MIEETKQANRRLVGALTIVAMVVAAFSFTAVSSADAAGGTCDAEVCDISIIEEVEANTSTTTVTVTGSSTAGERPADLPELPTFERPDRPERPEHPTFERPTFERPERPSFDTVVSSMTCLAVANGSQQAVVTCTDS